MDERKSGKVLEAMKRITEGLCILARRYIEAGVDGVYMASLGAERRFGLTKEQFMEWIAPFDQMILQAVKEEKGYCFLHVCNRDVNLEFYRDYDPALYDVVNWGTFEVPCSLKEGKDIFAVRPSWGVWQTEQEFWHPEQRRLWPIRCVRWWRLTEEKGLFWGRTVP